MTAKDRPDLEKRMRNDRIRIDTRMSEIIPSGKEKPEVLHEAMRYSTLNGGKRIRGLLCVWTHEVCGGSYPETAFDAACAIEFLHSYSLIHDDLPSMDDDNVRRGKESCHVKYSPAVAILAGDALQSLAFQTLASMDGIPEENTLEAVIKLAEAAGSKHLVGGQAADIQFEGTEPNPDKVEFIHKNKTAMLIAASMSIGAIISGGAGDKSIRMNSAGLKAGLAFQIVDDLLDVEGNQYIVGKALRKDYSRGKVTYPAVYGADRSRSIAEELISEAANEIEELDSKGLITYIFNLITNRIH